MKTRLSQGMLVRGKTDYYKIGKFLGSGGQGEVYEAFKDGRTYAIKWYFPNNANAEQKKAIEYLVKIGPPNRYFLWPIEIIESNDSDTFGYIMPIRRSDYYPLVDMMKRKIEPSFKSLIKAAMLLTDAFERLHNKNLCYRDISFGNVFIEPISGKILICDNDNITYESDELKNILGTPRFMAPEIVRGDSYPDIDSDRFSLGILLFYMFMIHHPFEGRMEDKIKCFDLPAMKKLYGESPVFIFHPTNSSNRPIKNRHDNASIFWELYPEFFRTMFTRLFTKGIRDKRKRPTEAEWKECFQALMDHLVYCKCGGENFISFDNPYSMHSKRCWNCNTPLVKPFRLIMDNKIIVLNKNTKIYSHHVNKNDRVDFNKVLAKVNPHPKKQGIWGLKNTGTTVWQTKNKSGESRYIASGYSIAIEDGLTLDFGGRSARVLR